MKQVDTTTASTTPFSQKKAQEKLTRKQEIFVNHLLENPTASTAAAAREAYPRATKDTQYQIASENMRKPQIVMALGKANDRVEQVLMNTVDNWGEEENSRKREIAVDTAKYIHDKIHGKATQRVDMKSTSVNLNIDLSKL